MASYALQDFLNAATADNIRVTNQYEVTITSGYSDVDAVLAKTILYGQSATIPKRTVNYANVSFKGYEVGNLVPTNIDMTKEFSIEFLDDMDGNNRRAFMAWQNKIMSFNISGGSVFEGDRGVNGNSVLRLHLFDKDNKTTSQIYKFYNVCVKEVGEVSLAYSGGDAAKFPVSFGCTFWEFEESKNGSLTDLV